MRIRNNTAHSKNEIFKILNVIQNTPTTPVSTVHKQYPNMDKNCKKPRNSKATSNNIDTSNSHSTNYCTNRHSKRGKINSKNSAHI